MDFLLPDVPLNKFMHEDKCCTLGLGCCLNRALFRRLLMLDDRMNGQSCGEEIMTIRSAVLIQ